MIIINSDVSELGLLIEDTYSAIQHNIIQQTIYLHIGDRDHGLLLVLLRLGGRGSRRVSRGFRR